MNIFRNFATLILLSVCVGSCNFSEMSAIKLGSGEGAAGTCDAKSKNQQIITDLNQLYPVPTFVSSISRKKVSRTDFHEVAEEKPQHDRDDFFIKNNSEVNLVVSRKCVMENLHLDILKDLEEQILKTSKNSIAENQSVLWKTPKRLRASDLEKLFDQIPCIVVSAPNGKLEPLSYSDTFYDKLNNMRNIFHIESDQQLPSVQNKVIVAVIDTGGTIDHPDLAGASWQNSTEMNGVAGFDDDQNGYIDDFYGWNFYTKNNSISTSLKTFPHGMHISGIIAAQPNNQIGVLGLAPQASTIMHLTVFADTIYGMQNSNALLAMEEALRYAVDNGSKVINLSLGRAGKSQTMVEALRYAVSKGAVVVASAGNNGREINDTDFSFAPAYYAQQLPGMLSVGASDATPSGSSNGPSDACHFSNFSTTYVDLFAPGCDSSLRDSGILSTGWPDLEPVPDDYVYMSGTSMSAPHVAAAASYVFAYLYEKSGIYPTNTLVEEILKASARSQANLESYTLLGRHLDMKSLLQYINSEVLVDPTTCLP